MSMELWALVRSLAQRVAALEANQERSAIERALMSAADQQSKELARDTLKVKRG